MPNNRYSRAELIVIIAVMILNISAEAGPREGWLRKEVDIRAPNNGRIKAIYYPIELEPPIRTQGHQPSKIHKKHISIDTLGKRREVEIESDSTFIASVIDSPPLDGFVPWAVVTLTDECSDDFDYSDYPESSIVGDYLASDPSADFAIGLFDTGASIHLASYAARQRINITNDLLTPNITTITGVSGEVDTLVSYPVGVFIAGVDVLEPFSDTDPNAVIADANSFVGHTNVSIAVGQAPEPNLPDIPTVIGTPLSVNFTTVINTNHEITVVYDGQIYNTVDLEFYESGDTSIPNYSSYLPLRMIPSGGYDVQYWPDYEAIMEFIFRPFYPSMIMGISYESQGRFFVGSVNLEHNSYESNDNQRFLLDTGAQISVIGDYVVADLGLNPANPDFWVEIEGVTGEVIEKPGFYIDLVELKGVGEWLTFTNVPMVHLENVLIPGGDGDPADGIIGMNLFTKYNLVLEGDYSAPNLYFKYIQLAGDIAPEGGDGIVNDLDIVALAECWMATSPPPSSNWDAVCDLAPVDNPDGVIDLQDFVVIAENYLK